MLFLVSKLDVADVAILTVNGKPAGEPGENRLELAPSTLIPSENSASFFIRVCCEFECF